MSTDRSAERSEGSSGHRADVQALRAVAVLMVVLYHVDAVLPGGFVGVDVFFVLSGFVIARSLRAEVERTGRIDLAAFYGRRIRRILPALAAMLTTVLLLSIVFAPQVGQLPTEGTGISAITVQANVFLTWFSNDNGYFGGAAEHNALLHTWSLSVEEQFYLVFPVLLIGLFCLGRTVEASRRAALAGVLVVSAASLVLCWLLTTARIEFHAPGQRIAFYAMPARAWEFGVGVAMALVRSHRRIPGLRFAGACLVGWSALSYGDATLFPGTAALAPVVGTAMLIGFDHPRATGWWASVVALRPVQWMGDISYSWYLWHWPLIVFAAALSPWSTPYKWVAAGVSLVPATLSYRYVENPIRFSSAANPLVTARVAVLCVTLPLLAALGLREGQERIYSFDGGSHLILHADAQVPCSGVAASDLVSTPCRWPAASSEGTVVLLGDSNAGQLSEGVLGAAAAMNHDTVIVVRDSCPFLDVVVLNANSPGDGDERACAAYAADAVEAVLDLEPAAVVFAISADWYIEDFGWSLMDDGHSVDDPDEKSAIIERALARTVQRFEDAGVDVVLLEPIPKLLGWSPRLYSPVRLLFEHNFAIPRGEADRYRQRSVEVIRAVAALTEATPLDLSEQMCPGETCLSSRDGEWVYGDGGHMSVHTSASLTADIESVLRTAVGPGSGD